MTGNFPRQGGPVLVCGNGWTLHDDFAEARKLFHFAPVIAVNDAARFVRAFALFSLHRRKLAGWRADQIKFRGCDDGYLTTHSAGKRHRTTNIGVDTKDHDVDFAWPDAVSTGSSGWSAVKMAKLMGFSHIIMCGIPMSKGNYATGTKGRWNKAWKDQRVVDGYRQGIMKDVGWHDNVFSMSGYTREKFGYPDEKAFPAVARFEQYNQRGGVDPGR